MQGTGRECGPQCQSRTTRSRAGHIDYQSLSIWSQSSILHIECHPVGLAKPRELLHALVEHLQTGPTPMPRTARWIHYACTLACSSDAIPGRMESGPGQITSSGNPVLWVTRSVMLPHIQRLTPVRP